MNLLHSLYPLVKPLLFKLDAEIVHHNSLAMMNRCQQLGLATSPLYGKPIKLMGLTFPNKVGLAAGLDKDGKAMIALSQLGFGAIEIGTVTPRPQGGNPKPRLFRLDQADAIINRMGFNNDGVEALVARLKAKSPEGVVLGINIGKNKNTPNEDAVSDYEKAFAQVYQYADYITINLSSPNTPGLRDLQGEAFLADLMTRLHQLRDSLSQQHAKHVPIVVKVAPDLEHDALNALAKALVENQADGVIATNTTIDKTAVSELKDGNEQGGLSGAPLTEKSTEIIAQLAKSLDGAMPIIGVGGIMSAEDAQVKMQAGASMVQLYSGLIYKGPKLITDVAKALD
jgi:dihydroorotate dehydrogenase